VSRQQLRGALLGLLISRLKVRFLPRSPAFHLLTEGPVHKISWLWAFLWLRNCFFNYTFLRNQFFTALLLSHLLLLIAMIDDALSSEPSLGVAIDARRLPDENFHLFRM
jgi:hypothetical protein